MSSRKGLDRGVHKRVLRISLLVCFILALLAGYPVFAEDPSPESPTSPGHQKIHVLTLHDLIRIALDANPDIWAEHYSVEQAEARVHQARAGRLPRLEAVNILGPVPAARGDAVYSPDERSDLLSDLGIFTRMEISLNQPLFTFGRLKANIRAAVEGLESARSGIERSRGELVRTVKELYFTLQLNNELFDVVSDTAEQFSKAVTKAEELLEQDSGTVTQQDLLKLRYGTLRASSEVIEIRKGRDLVHSAIKRLLCLPPGEDFDLAQKRLLPEKIEFRTLDTYIDAARHNRAEWKQLEAGIRAKEAELHAEELQFYPNIFLSGFFRFAAAPNREKQENPFVVEDFNYILGGVVLGWRYDFDFGLPQRIREKRAELYELLQKQRGAESGLRLDVERAYREAVEKQRVLDLAGQARKNGRALATTTAATFQLGLGDARDVFEALKMYAEASAQYYLAAKEFNVAVAELSRVTGVEAISIGSSPLPPPHP